MLNGLKQHKPSKTASYTSALLSLAGAMLIALIIYSPYIPKYYLEYWDIAKETIYSPRFIEIETDQDKEKLKRYDVNAQA